MGVYETENTGRMKKLIPKTITGVLIAGILLQLVVMPFSYHGDMTNFDGWGIYILDRGASSVYDHDFSSQLLSDANYPPLMLWTCALVSGMIRILRGAVWQMNVWIPVFPSQLVTVFAGEMPYIYLFKILVILANAGIAFFIYKMLRRREVQKDRTPLLAAGLFLFNPAVLYGTTVWGQIDLVPIFFLFASVYVLFYKKQVLGSSILIITALLFKQTTIIFLPVYCVAIIKYFGMRPLVKSLILMSASVWLIYAPFVSRWLHLFSPFVTYLTKVQLASDNEHTTKFAWNLWMFVHGVKPVSDVQPHFWGVTFQVAGYVCVFAIFVFVVFHYKKISSKNLMTGLEYTLFACFLIAFASFLFLTRLHERHLLHALPFFAILIGMHKRFMHAFIYISFFILVNLVVAWDQMRLNLHDNLFMMIIIRILITGAVALFVYYLRKFSCAMDMRKNGTITTVSSDRVFDAEKRGRAA